MAVLAAKVEHEYGRRACLRRCIQSIECSAFTYVHMYIRTVRQCSNAIVHVDNKRNAFIQSSVSADALRCAWHTFVFCVHALSFIHCICTRSCNVRPLVLQPTHSDDDKRRRKTRRDDIKSARRGSILCQQSKARHRHTLYFIVQCSCIFIIGAEGLQSECHTAIVC